MSASADDKDTLSVFTRLLQKEFYLLRERGELSPAMRMLREGRQTEYLRMLLARAESNDLPRWDVLVSTRPYMNKLRNAFSSEQKLRFMKMYSVVWAAWCYQPQAINIDQKTTKRELASAWVFRADHNT